MPPNGRTLFVGVDWATQEHFVFAMDDGGQALGERRVSHSAEGFSELADWLLAFGYDSSSVRVAIEVPHGSVVEALMERGFTVFSINPKQLDRFRDRFSMSGAKDDRRDAKVLADSLRTDGSCYRVVEKHPPNIIEIRELSRLSDDLVQERVRLSNRLREQLHRYYPQFLTLNADVAIDWMLDLWMKVQTPDAAKRNVRASITAVLKRNRVRRVDTDAVLAALRKPPIAVSPGTEAAVVAHIRVLVDLLRVVNRSLRDTRKKLSEAIESIEAPKLETQDSEPGQKDEQRDVEIVRSMPGVGTIVLGTLLAEARAFLRDRNYEALRAYAGSAPVTRRSGKAKPLVLMRRGCNTRLRNAIYHWARVASQHDELCKKRYAALRERGHSHARALRSVADRLLYVMFAMLRNRTTYQAKDAA